MIKFFQISIIYFCALFLIFSASFADHRKYVWTYQFMTMEKGKAEFENYLTFSTPDANSFTNNTTLENQMELEVGMNDRFDFSIYQVFKQKPGSNFTFDSYKLRARYKLMNKDEFIFDPLIYAEYKGYPDFSKHKFEFKLIMAKDIENFNISFNPIIELESVNDWKPIFLYALGLSYEFHKLICLGIEFRGSEKGHYIAPVISHGTPKLWIAAAPTFMLGGIRTGEPEFLFRTIIGVGI